MTETDDKPTQNGSPAGPGRSGNLRRPIGVVVFVCVVIFFASRTWQYARLSAASESEFKRLEVTRAELTALHFGLKTQRAEADHDKRTVANLLRLCRSASDIPHLAGTRIATSRIDFDKLSIYVPEGKHRLEISCKWMPPKNRTPNNESDPAVSGNRVWNVPLLPISGYRLEIESDREGTNVLWHLTGNHPDFEPRSETVPIAGFKHQGSSMTGSDELKFPNQTRYRSDAQLKEAISAPAGLVVMDYKLQGSVSDQPMEVRFDVRVISDHPATVTASEAQRLAIMRKEKFLQPYQGGGKYDLVMPDSEAAD